MNEFEWRRQMRELRQPLPPRRDLWRDIDAALDGGGRVPEPITSGLPDSRPRRRPWPLVASIAASIVLAAGLAGHQRRAPTAAPLASTGSASWKPADPRLAGAAIELDAARMELRLALEQAPDSMALRRLLDRTELQQTQLRQLTHQAG